MLDGENTDTISDCDKSSSDVTSNTECENKEVRNNPENTGINNEPSLNTDVLDTTLFDLKTQILKLSNKQQSLLNKWIRDWTSYLHEEESFDPNRYKRYSYGEIIHVRFGYNIGNEEGGSRYAVVVDRRNRKSSGLITVVPITKLGSGKTKEKLHPSEVYLGSIIPESDIESYALPLQIRCVSKLRIIWPKYGGGVEPIKLDSEKMTEIKRIIEESF